MIKKLYLRYLLWSVIASGILGLTITVVTIIIIATIFNSGVLDHD